MNHKIRTDFIILGISIFLGLAALGMFLSQAAHKFKLLERSVTVKGLSEREYMADIVLWPIQFTVANNDLPALYSSLEEQASSIQDFLVEQGIAQDEISVFSTLNHRQICSELWKC